MNVLRKFKGSHLENWETEELISKANMKIKISFGTKEHWPFFEDTLFYIHFALFMLNSEF